MQSVEGEGGGGPHLVAACASASAACACTSAEAAPGTSTIRYWPSGNPNALVSIGALAAGLGEADAGPAAALPGVPTPLRRTRRVHNM